MSETETIATKDVGTLDLGKWTKEELIAREAQVSRRCRGPLKAGVRDQINVLLKQAQETEDKKDQDKILEDAKSLDASSRKPCGYDMNKIFLAGPLDGKQHKYQCPECGVMGTYTAAGPVSDDAA